MTAALPLLFLEGLLAFVSPCTLPMLPVYLTYLAAETDNGRRASAANTVAFVAGFSLIFTLLGATATSLGSLLDAHRLLLRRASGLVVAAFGLHFAGVLKLTFLDADKSPVFRASRGGAAGAFLFGCAFSLGWTPCLGPLLGAALMLASDANTVGQGAFGLFVFSMGLGVPYVLSAIFFSRMKRLFQALRKNGYAIKRVSGVILIAAGIAIFTGTFAYWEGLFW